MLIGVSKKEISIQHGLDTKGIKFVSWSSVVQGPRTETVIIITYCVVCCESKVHAGTAGHKELGYISQLHPTMMFTVSCHITAAALFVK